jgi:hypothetical protein
MRPVAFVLVAALAPLSLALSCGGIAVIDAEDAASSSSASSVASGGADVEVSLESAIGDAVCIPGTTPDQLSLSFTVLFENHGTDVARPRLDSAGLVGTSTINIAATPTLVGSIPPGTSLAQSFVKTPGSTSGDPCDLCADTNITLEATFNVDGTLVGLSDFIDSFSCTF